MKNKSVLPTSFFTGLFSQKVLLTLSLFVFFAFNASAQPAVQQPNEDTTWVPTYVFQTVTGNLSSSAKLQNGAFNMTHQVAGGTLHGRTQNVDKQLVRMKQGSLVTSTIATIVTQDVLKFDATGNLTSGGTSPSFFAHRNKQLIIQTLPMPSFDTIYLMLDEYVGLGYMNAYKKVSGNYVALFPISIAGIASIRDHGNGNILVTGEFTASDFGQPGTWSNIFLYNLSTSSYIPWNPGTHSNYLCYAYPENGNVNSTIFPIVQKLPTGGGQLLFGKKGINGYFSVTPTDLVAQDIKSVIVYSETDIYLYKTGSIINDTKLIHSNGTTWSDVPNSPVQSFSSGYNDFLDHNPTTGKLTSNFVTINVSAGPSSATVNTPAQQTDIDDYQGGMWEIAGKFYKWSSVGGSRLLTKADVTPPPTTIVTIPTEAQVFPYGTTFVTISGNANAYEGDTVKVYNGTTVIKTDVADVNGTWGMILTGLTPGSYSYKITRTDPHGNENMGTVITFTISANSTVGVTDIDEASTVLVAQSGNNITLTSEKQMDGYVVSNTAGQIVSVLKQNSKQFDFSLENHSTGIYYITIYSDRNKYVKTVLKR